MLLAAKQVQASAHESALFKIQEGSGNRKMKKKSDEAASPLLLFHLPPTF